MKKILAELTDFIELGLVLGFLGGLGRALHYEKDNFTWLCFFYRVISATFVSILVGLAMMHLDYPPALEAAIIGASGYAAVDLLRAVPGVVKRKTDKMG